MACSTFYGKAVGGVHCPKTTRIGTFAITISVSGATTSTRKPASPYWSWSLKKLVSDDRTSVGRDDQTSFLIIDAQSVKNTDPAEKKGYDAGKKVSGIKRHLAVDTRGLPHLLHITTANISDKAGAREMLESAAPRLEKVQGVLVDGGYSGEPFAQFVNECISATVEVAKRNELHTFAVIPKRWVVERTISWLEKCRRLWKNCERKLISSLAMLRLAFISLLLRRH